MANGNDRPFQNLLGGNLSQAISSRPLLFAALNQRFPAFFRSPGFGTASTFDLAELQQQRDDEFREFQLGRVAEGQAMIDAFGAEGRATIGPLAGELEQRGTQFFGSEPQRFASFATPILSGFDDLTSQTRAGGAQLVRNARAREQALLGQLDTLGDQERADTRRDFANLSAQTQARNAALGLSGTTAGSGQLAGVARLQNQAIGGLNERLRRERLGLQERTSADLFNAQQAAFLQNLDARRTALGARSDLGLLGLQRGDQAFQNELSLIEAARLAPLNFESQLLGTNLDFLTEGVQFLPPTALPVNELALGSSQKI